MKNFFFLYFCLAFFSCAPPSLYVQEVYQDPQKHPAILLNIPFPEESIKPQANLAIQWHLGSPSQEGNFLALSTLDENLKKKRQVFFLSKKRGILTYPLPIDKRLIAYKVELYEAHKQVKAWRHKLWVDQVYVFDEE